ncbi:hypothetical protein Peur_035092 [Populus x canadensis]
MSSLRIPQPPKSQTSQNLTPKPILFTNLLSLALTATLNSPFSSLAIASLNSQPPLLFPTTHFLNPRTCRLDYKMGKSGLAHLQTQVVFQQIRNLHHLHSHGGFQRISCRKQS